MTSNKVNYFLHKREEISKRIYLTISKLIPCQIIKVLLSALGAFKKYILNQSCLSNNLKNKKFQCS